ncbi:MAG: hypothetical protein R2788_23215 [Saprospiraceae bacterium]
MKNIFFLFLFSLFTQIVLAQSLTITNGTKEKTFNPDGFYEIILGEGPNRENLSCCESIQLIGRLSALSKDSLHMDLTKYTNRKFMDDFKIEDQVYSVDKTNYGNFAYSDIYSIKFYKSEKSIKRKGNLTGVGALLFFSGILTSANYFFISDSDSKKTALKSGVVQFGIGLTLISISKPKEYKFKGEDRVWRVK